MRRTIFLAFAAAIPLLACTDDDAFVENAVDRARTHCEAQGRQFHLSQKPALNSGDLMERDVEVTGTCVAPGEPGYNSSPKN